MLKLFLCEDRRTNITPKFMIGPEELPRVAMWLAPPEEEGGGGGPRRDPGLAPGRFHQRSESLGGTPAELSGFWRSDMFENPPATVGD